jgi:hypothetical protein
MLKINLNRLAKALDAVRLTPRRRPAWRDPFGSVYWPRNYRHEMVDPIIGGGDRPSCACLTARTRYCGRGGRAFARAT